MKTGNDRRKRSVGLGLGRSFRFSTPPKSTSTTKPTVDAVAAPINRGRPVAKILDRLQPATSYCCIRSQRFLQLAELSDRATITGTADESVPSDSHSNKVVRAYGWYLRQYVTDAKGKGATVIICSPVPHNTWADENQTRLRRLRPMGRRRREGSGALSSIFGILSPPTVDALGQEKTAEFFWITAQKKAAPASMPSRNRRPQTIERRPLATISPASAATPSP